jgi:N-glycosylase/DNA lyase
MSRGLENKPKIRYQKIDRRQAVPTKHIDDETWRKVEQAAVKATIATKRSVKETQMLRWLILKGLEEISEEDFQKLVKGKD